MQLNLTPTPTQIFEIVHDDTFTFQQVKFLSLIDLFSHYSQAYESICKMPQKPLNGTEFKYSVISGLVGQHKINNHFCLPNHPESHGLMERFQSTSFGYFWFLNTNCFSNTTAKIKMIYYTILRTIILCIQSQNP